MKRSCRKLSCRVGGKNVKLKKRKNQQYYELDSGSLRHIWKIFTKPFDIKIANLDSKIIDLQKFIKSKNTLIANLEETYLFYIIIVGSSLFCLCMLYCCVKMCHRRCKKPTKKNKVVLIQNYGIQDSFSDITEPQEGYI